MGYYTRYSLTVTTPGYDAPIRRTFAQTYGPSGRPRSPFVEDGSSALLDGAVKWYAWREDCGAVSGLHPGVEFVIDGAGEDGDRWRSTWLGGEEIAWDDGRDQALPPIEVTP